MKEYISYERERKIEESVGEGGSENYRPSDRISEALSKIAFKISSEDKFRINTSATYLMPHQSSMIGIRLSYDSLPKDRYSTCLTISHFLGKKFKMPKDLERIIEKSKLKKSK